MSIAQGTRIVNPDLASAEFYDFIIKYVRSLSNEMLIGLMLLQIANFNGHYDVNCWFNTNSKNSTCNF